MSSADLTTNLEQDAEQPFTWSVLDGGVPSDAAVDPLLSEQIEDDAAVANFGHHDARPRQDWIAARSRDLLDRLVPLLRPLVSSATDAGPEMGGQKRPDLRFPNPTDLEELLVEAELLVHACDEPAHGTTLPSGLHEVDDKELIDVDLLSADQVSDGLLSGSAGSDPLLAAAWSLVRHEEAVRARKSAGREPSEDDRLLSKQLRSLLEEAVHDRVRPVESPTGTSGPD